MKKFIVMILTVTTFFVGLGGLIEGVGARFKSDEKALELIKRARAAVGGENAIAGVRSMTITGKATKTFEFDGAQRSEQGDLEINFELPNRMSRMLKIGDAEKAGGNQLIERRVDVTVVEKGDLKLKTQNPEAAADGLKKVTIIKKDGANEEVLTEDISPIILRKGDGDAVFTSEDGKTVTVDGKKVFIRKGGDGLHEGVRQHQQTELFRTTLALLLTAPEGVDASYVYAGEGTVDGAACDIVEARVGAASVKLYLDKSSSLPRMMTYQAMKPFAVKISKDEAKANPEGVAKTFARQKHETAEYQVKFSDYRSVGGLQLPFRWTQTVGGNADETVDITSYEINPANIAEKLKEVPVKTFVRVPMEKK
jgi:hypothetical protein